MFSSYVKDSLSVRFYIFSVSIESEKMCFKPAVFTPRIEKVCDIKASQGIVLSYENYWIIWLDYFFFPG